MPTHYGGALSPVLFGMGYIDQGTWRRKGAVMALVSFVTTFVCGFLWWNLIGIWEAW